MFNRQPFNNGKFNITTGQTNVMSGLAIMKLTTSKVNSSQIISSKGSSNLKMGSYGDNTKYRFGESKADMLMTTRSAQTTDIFVGKTISNIILGTLSEQKLAGESMVDLQGLVLKPGDELVINTCDMTVTVNGQNAMKYFTGDSEFFSLLKGMNEIIYSDGNSNRKVNIDVLWKDRWL